jgi:type VI protein secretion system component VasK
MIGDWLTSVALGPSQLQPFLAPVFELERLGRAEIEVTLERAWQREVASYVRRISRKFPFDAQSPVDATPRELDELLQPSTGRIASFVRRYLGTLGDAHGRGTFKLRDALEERLSLPSDLRPTLTAAAALVGHLYDAAGHPVPLSLQVATVPFEHGTDPRMGLTLVYLTIGEVSINNFNQKPGLATVRFDWTREQVSQVGVQLTNLDTQEKTFPEPIATPSSSWSALRLLAAGKASPVKKPAGGELYTWDVHYQRESSHTTKVRFIIVGNPTPLFALTPAEPALALQGALP